MDGKGEPMSEERKTILHDEQGNWSMGRILLLGSLVLTFLLIVIDTFVEAEVPGPAYALLGTVFTGLLAWVAGPRIAQYVGPQMGAVASGISQAAKSRRLRGTDRFREDDERG